MIRCMKGLQYILTNSIQLNPFKWNFMHYGAEPGTTKRWAYLQNTESTSVEGHLSHIHMYTYTSTPSHNQQ